MDAVRNARPDIGQFRGLDPARPRERDSAFSGPRTSDIRSPDFHRRGTVNNLNEQHFRGDRGRYGDGDHRHHWGGDHARWRYCRTPYNYYCRGYRPLYPYHYYPYYYPYAYSSAYWYDPFPYYGGSTIVGGAVAYADPYYTEPVYTSSPTYAEGYAEGVVTPESGYQEVPSTAPPAAVEAAPGATGSLSPPPSEAAAENLEYKPLTEPGLGTAIGEGNTAFRSGRYDEARQHYSKAILADERDGYAKMLYAVSNFAAGDYGVAATAIRRSLMTTQELIDYPIDVRTMYPDIMTLHGHMQRLAQHVAASPEDKDASLVLAYLHYSIGEAEPARDMFKLMAEDDTSDTLLSQLHKASNRALESLKKMPPPPPTADQPGPTPPQGGPPPPVTP